MATKQGQKWQTFGVRLKEARERRGLSQRRLGLSVGLEQYSASPRINRYELGGMLPRDMRDAERIAEVLGVPLSYLFEADPVISELLVEIGGMDPKERSALLEEIRRRKGAEGGE